MKVLFLTPYFPPETGAPQTRIYELGLRLSRMGHEVSVLTTFPNYPSGIVPKPWRGYLYWHGRDQGMDVYRVWSYTTPNKGFVRRVVGHLSFACSSALVAPLLGKVDAIVVESPPLFDGFSAIWLGLVKRAPYLFTVADLWPESAVQMGVLKNRFLIWISKQIELLFYRRAGALLAITEGIRKKIVADGIDSSKVLLFQNAVDAEFFRPDVEGDVRRALGLPPGDFMVLYAGTLGLAHNLGCVLDAARLCQGENQSRIRFVLAGDGAEKEALQQKAAELALKNVLFPAPYPKSRMPQVLNAADCVVISLRDLGIFRGALPTKLFEAMACAKPVVLAVRGEAEDVVRRANCGICVKPGDAAAMRHALLQIANNPAEAKAMGMRGREYVMEHFSRDARASQLAGYLEAAIADDSGAVTKTALRGAA